MKNFWDKCIKKFILVSLPAICGIITLLTVFNKGLEPALQKLGVIGCVLIFCLCFMLTLVNEVNKIIKSREILEKVSVENNDLSQKIINNLFKISALFIKYPNDAPQINIHFYSYQKENNAEYLHKMRMFGYETDRLSVDYSLEKCRLDANSMVMCKAFKKNCVVFENLTSHVITYDLDVKDYIDKNMKWVLACPVWKQNDINQKYGVIAIFGFMEIAKDEETAKIAFLKNLCLELAKSVSEFI